jgi:hypothetical protein
MGMDVRLTLYLIASALILSIALVYHSYHYDRWTIVATEGGGVAKMDKRTGEAWFVGNASEERKFHNIASVEPEPVAP